MMNAEMAEWVVFDLDGTLADITHRLHFLKGVKVEGANEWAGTTKKDWNGFNANLHLDVVKKDIRQLHRMVFDAGYNIAIVTGRSSQYSKQTIQWLLENNIPYNELHMRPEGNFQSDYIVKQKIYDDHFKHRKIIFVVDDRDQVVQMWRDNGITCLQCQKGDY